MSESFVSQYEKVFGKTIRTVKKENAKRAINLIKPSQIVVTELCPQDYVGGAKPNKDCDWGITLCVCIDCWNQEVNANGN